MATKTRDIAPLVKAKRNPNTSKTKSLVVTNAINLIATNRKNIYLKSKVSSSHDKTQVKKPSPSPSPSTYPNIHHNQTLNHRTSIDKPPSSFDNTQVKKNPTWSNDLNIVHTKPNVARGSLFINRPSSPSSLDNVQGKKLASSSSCVPPSIHNKQNLAQRRLSFENRPPQSSSHDHSTQGKKLPSSISDPNFHNKHTIARRRLSFDHRPPASSFHDSSPQRKKLVPKSDLNTHRKQTPTRRRLSINHKPPLSPPMLKKRTSSNPRERIPKPSMSSSSKNSTSQKPPLSKLSKAHQTSNKGVIGKQHGVGLYSKAMNMKQDSPVGLTAKEFIITSNLKDIVANVDPHEDEELKQEEHQELVIEDSDELSDIVNIDEYLKEAESSLLYVKENQEAIKMEVPEEQQLVEEITNHKELEEIKNVEPSNLDRES